MRRIVAFTVFALWLIPAAGYSTAAGFLRADPLHQRACYKLISAVPQYIRSGKGQSDVLTRLTAPDGTPSYDLSIRYTMNIQFFGAQNGTLKLYVPTEYYTTEFWEHLRTSHIYRAPDFKIQWLGRETIRTALGNFQDTDKIRIYDVDTARSDTPMQQLDMTAWIDPSVPAFGGAKLQLKGKIAVAGVGTGIDVTAMTEYTEDRSQCFN